MATQPRDSSIRESDHEGFLAHKGMRWLKVALVLCLVVIVAYLLVDVQPRHNGGTWFGYTLGTVGAGLIIWLALLGIRKRNMTRGKWSLKAWTSAHVYLGLALIVVATLHTGFQFGWNVHTLAYGLMMLVIASGIWGISVYAALPAKLADNRRGMTKGQMLASLDALDRQLENAAQPLGRAEADLVIAALEQDAFKVGLVTRLSGRNPRCRTRRALEQMVASEETAKVLSLLRKREAQLDQIRRHLRLRAMLEVWLYIHVPVTIALLGALTAHIVSVFYYW
ncbi:hypothetical protein M3P36_10650 [Altererythrobacter sp. KTW20L]|uniref:hypothetical protein n=1 Tax=Altererythrobacter sp. KTW20L TaxID=2942210 RepID=UPI0020C095F5|nr:hypothetical protein [Altererythrobacter sp. KTW20L]MCL6251498.1 hypothetical protein [Altererythrobacter sp. KTW20L]